MTLQQLIYFTEVAETLHFTTASQKLYITQSTLSYAINALERELDVPLFIRKSGKSVAMTNFGKALLPLAKRAITDFEEIEKTIQGLRNPMSGIVNVAYSYINGNRFVPKMFGAFSSLPQFEEIAVNFEVNHQRVHFEDDVASGKIDLAFSCTKATDGLEVVPFARQQLYVMLPPYHPLADRDTLGVEDIADNTMIGYDQNRNLDKWIFEMFRRHGLKPNVDSYSADWMEQLSQVSLGKGIAILPMLHFDPEIIRAIPLDDPMQTRQVYMMWAANRPLPPAVQYVRDCCMNFYDEPPLI